MGTKSQPFLPPVSIDPFILMCLLSSTAAPSQGGWGGGCPPPTDPRLLQSVAGREGLRIHRGVPWSVPVAAWAGAGASRGQKQQERGWEAGLAPVLRWETSCAELSAVTAAKPCCGGDAAMLPASARARTGGRTKQQLLSGQRRHGFRRATGSGGGGLVAHGMRLGAQASPLPAATAAGIGTGNGNKPPAQQRRGQAIRARRAGWESVYAPRFTSL